MSSVIKPLEVSPVTCIKAPILSAIPSTEEGDFQDFVITTGDLDRDQEVVDPDGLDVTWFSNGPASWFFNHQSLPFPIGSAKPNPKDPNSKAVVRRDGGRWVARCHFNRMFPEAIIVADLVKAGQLAYTSIGFLSLSREMLSDEDSIKLGSTYPVIVHRKTQLTESSVVGIPANQNAIADYLARGMVFGTTLTPLMTKQFRRWINDEQKIYSVSGMFPASERKSDNATEQTKSTSTSQEVVIVTEPVEKCGTPKVEPTPTAPVATAPSQPTPPPAPSPKPTAAKKSNDDGEDGESHDQKAGYQTLLAMREGMGSILKLAAEKLPSIDNQEVRDMVSSMCRGIQNGMETMSEAAGSAYEGFPEMEEMDYGFGDGKTWWESEENDMDDDQTDEDDEEDTEDDSQDEDEKSESDEDDMDDEEKALVEELTKVTEELEEYAQ